MSFAKYATMQLHFIDLQSIDGPSTPAPQSCLNAARRA
jgi:hypothetical protein